jgi:hypothetical protein
MQAVPQVLTTNALICCPHGGKGTTVPTDPKWTVNSGFVSVEGDPGALACPFLPLPCLGYTLQSMGLNATQIDGRKVILVTDFNHTITGLPLVMTEFHQTYDESTPAPVPSGQSAPSASEALADFSKPLVVSPIPSIPVKLTPVPPPVPVSFTLATQHPLKWVLTFINEPQKYHQDLTNGAQGVTVTPAGGEWTTPSLQISVLFSTLFLSSLAPGRHHVYLTGVSQRGLSSHMDVTLEVTP